MLSLGIGQTFERVQEEKEGWHVYRYVQAHCVSGSGGRSIVELLQKLSLGIRLTWERVQEEKKHIRMTYISVRTSSLGVGILAEKHCWVATKVVFGEWTDLRKSPRRKEIKKHIRIAYISVRTSSLGVGILAEKHRRVATKVAFGEWTDLRKSPRRK